MRLRTPAQSAATATSVRCPDGSVTNIPASSVPLVHTAAGAGAAGSGVAGTDDGNGSGLAAGGEGCVAAGATGSGVNGVGLATAAGAAGVPEGSDPASLRVFVLAGNVDRYAENSSWLIVCSPAYGSTAAGAAEGAGSNATGALGSAVGTPLEAGFPPVVTPVLAVEPVVTLV